MWTEVRWRTPLLDSERSTLQDVATSLEMAYGLDKRLEYPWREWNEILEYLGSDARVTVDESDDHQAGALIGYRRNPVRVTLAAGWSIQIPGSFADTWEDDTWCAWDSQITVWFTAFKKTEVDGTSRPASRILSEFEPDSDDIVTYQTDNIAGLGSIRWVERDEQRYWKLSARSAVNGRFCVVTICFASESERPLILQIWESLTRS
jgi:hypothetical protein